MPTELLVSFIQHFIFKYQWTAKDYQETKKTLSIWNTKTKRNKKNKTKQNEKEAAQRKHRQYRQKKKNTLIIIVRQMKGDDTSMEQEWETV